MLLTIRRRPGCSGSTLLARAGEKEGIREMPPRGILLVGNEDFCRSAEGMLLAWKRGLRFIHARRVSIEILIDIREPYLAVLNDEDLRPDTGEMLDGLLRRFPSMPAVIVSSQRGEAVPEGVIVIPHVSELQTRLQTSKLNCFRKQHP